LQRAGGAFKQMRNLLKNKLVHHDSSKYDGYRLTPLVRALFAAACDARAAPRHRTRQPRHRTQACATMPLCAATRMLRAAACLPHTPPQALGGGCAPAARSPRSSAHAAQGYDFLAIHALTSRGALSAIGRKIGVGKESDVYEARFARASAP
jgi:hypothetical protein